MMTPISEYKVGDRVRNKLYLDNGIWVGAVGTVRRLHSRGEISVHWDNTDEAMELTYAMFDSIEPAEEPKPVAVLQAGTFEEEMQRLREAEQLCRARLDADRAARAVSCADQAGMVSCLRVELAELRTELDWYRNELRRYAPKLVAAHERGNTSGSPAATK